MVATICRRRPQKQREWLAQYPYAAQSARSERPDRLEGRPVSRWKASSRTAARAIAVIQVERLKNPCRLWMWKQLGGYLAA